MKEVQKTTVRAGSSISTLGLLGVLFIGLKLTGHIDWSWIWVLSPFWIPWAIIGGAFALILSAMLIVATMEWIEKKVTR